MSERHTGYVVKEKIHQIKKKVRDDKNDPHKNPHHRRTVSGRAVDRSQRCKMAMIVFQSNDNRWHQHRSSQLEHSFHAQLDDKAKVLGEKDLQSSDIRLVRFCLLPFFLITSIQFHHYEYIYYTFANTACYKFTLTDLEILTRQKLQFGTCQMVT